MPQLYAATLSYGHPEWTFYVGAILAGVVLLATLRLPSLDEIPPAPKKGEGRVINAEGSAGGSGAAAGGSGGGDGGGGELRVRREFTQRLARARSGGESELERALLGRGPGGAATGRTQSARAVRAQLYAEDSGPNSTAGARSRASMR